MLGFATPWLSTKTDDAGATGRYGVGLSTLQSLSPTLEVHSGHYHFRIGDPTIESCELPDLPPSLGELGRTTLRIPLQRGDVQPQELEEWLDRWDASALLFLHNVTCVALLDLDGGSSRRLSLSRRTEAAPRPDGTPAVPSREVVDAADGRSWLVYSAEFPAPAGQFRAQKATGATTHVAVALPLSDANPGQVYAGLPVSRSSFPLYASAQFDPLTGRADFDNNPWNTALVKLVAQLWTHAVLDLFERRTASTWQVIPLPDDEIEGNSSTMVEALEAAVLGQARGEVAARLSFPVSEHGRVELCDLAVESEPLEGILTAAEIARLAQRRTTLPNGARDAAGSWRSVLADWRNHRDDLPDEVNVERALDLLGDSTRSPDSDIALAAVALREGLHTALLETPCVISHDGLRLTPAGQDSALAVFAGTAPLAEQLGVGVRLHGAHLAQTDHASEVLAWLRECGTLLDASDIAEVLRHVAQAGRFGPNADEALTDKQVCSLREAFENLDPHKREELGSQVGESILLESYTYDAAGKRRPGLARPADAYLPRTIDRAQDSFGSAAGKSAGIVWLNGRYSTVLRPMEGQATIGAQAFLRLLGAETAPRLQPHPQLVRHYVSDQRRGLPQNVGGGPDARASAMRRLNATHTLEDHVSPALRAAAMDIALEVHGEPRRARAKALLTTLGRAWDRRLRKFAQVDAALGHYSWQFQGKTHAYWLAQAGDVAWLDDENGDARKPADLRVRTPGTEAIYGSESDSYLHPELDRPIRHELLAALGVSSDPSRSELVDRLRDIRNAGKRDEVPIERVKREAILIYRALARDLDGEPDEPDLTEGQLRSAFARPGLVLTNSGWQPPASVLAGPDIFEDYRPFAPEPEVCALLWKALRLRAPSPDDCLDVLRQIARGRTSPPDDTEEAILLETLRGLAGMHSRVDVRLRKKLKKLALWTSKGWMRNRPVYAADDPAVAAGLGNQLPIWRPGGELKQFRHLTGHLGVTEIPVNDAKVVDPGDAWHDSSLTDLYRQALALMREDLQRNDPTLATNLAAVWESLTACDVRVHPHLALSIHVTPNDVYECKLNAKIDIERAAVFVSEREALAGVDGGGRALAALIGGNTRSAALTWLAACDRAGKGTTARPLELASDRSEQARAALDTDPRLTQIRERTGRPPNTSRGASKPPTSNNQPHESIAGASNPRDQSSPAAPLRTLVDPQSYKPVDRRGRTETGSLGTASGTGGNSSTEIRLKEPSIGSPGPRERTPLRGYTDIEKENVGLELLRMLFDSDEDQIADLRSQHGVGADAIDQLQNYFELKVSAGSEPSEVTLTASEYERASATPKFFLVIVSNIEGDDARPTVRLVVDPLQQLREVKRGTTTLAGISEATSLIYEFVPVEDE